MGKLDGKIALVTGGNSGIGLATAKQFVHEGAYVFITGRRSAELAAAVKEIGRNVTGVQGDVSNVADVERLFTQIKQEKGKLDIVFANAGVVRYAALGAISEEFFDAIFDTNVKGVLFTVQRALPLLPRRRIHHSQCVDGRQQRPTCIQRLLRDQGGGAVVRADMDDRLEGTPHSSERREPRLNRHARIA